MGRRWMLAVVGLAVPCAVACGPGGPELSAEAKRGRQAWMGTCTACHATDPTQEGSLGPAVAGSSLELLEAKVLRNEYPPGYTPKRDSSVMPPYPQVSGEIGALHAYLSEAAAGP